MEKVIGFTYNGHRYIYQRNIQGDIIRIYDAETDEVVTKYSYDAWGNQNVKNKNEDNIGDINPIRYRGYYYDKETGLYYLNAKYYDPKLGRFISPDTFSILDDTMGEINGLNLYMYCKDNPVMYADPSGLAPQWLKIAGWIGLAVGTALCIGAITILTAGVGTATFLGAVAVGAAKGTLIGAGIGIGVGTIAGGVGAVISDENFGSNEFWSDVLYGGMLGFGIGSLIGAITGGFAGANGWYNAKAIEFTNVGSQEVVLGRSPGYVEVAKSKGATYFHTSDEIWNATQSMKGVGSKGMWRINKAFLKQQIKAGARFTLLDPKGGYFYAKEFAFVLKYGTIL